MSGALFDTGLPEVAGLWLQCCDGCGRVNYPRRELCGNCLGDSLHWREVSGNGVVQASTALYYPLEQNFSQHLPWEIASIKLDVGPVVFAHLQPGVTSGEQVSVAIVRERFNNRVLAATLGDDSARVWLASVNFSEIEP